LKDKKQIPNNQKNTHCIFDQLNIANQDQSQDLSAEHLKRLFSFGFSTKHKKYGFGLHNSFLLAQELKGSLEACSDGEGLGATFTLSLPLSW